MAYETLVGDLKPSTLREDIAELLADAILTGKLRPGDRLNESALARQWHVSRAPIREALQQLEERGLVVNRPRRGMFVVSLDEEEVQKINSLRLVLEAEALRLCRAHATPALVRRLQQIADKMERGSEAPTVEAVQLDFEFHRTIWSHSGNEYLERVLTSVTAPLFAYSLLTKLKAEKMRMILDSHRPLVDYVAGKLKRKAADVIYDHIALRWNQPDRFASRRLLPEKD